MWFALDVGPIVELKAPPFCAQCTVQQFEPQASGCAELHFSNWPLVSRPLSMAAKIASLGKCCTGVQLRIGSDTSRSRGEENQIQMKQSICPLPRSNWSNKVLILKNRKDELLQVSVICCR